VRIGPPPGNHMTPAVVRLAFAAWFALLTLILAVASATRLWSLPFALAAIWLGIRGHARLAAALSQPRRTTFAGQVIARWGDAGQDEDPYCAVDDGERAWAFTAPAGPAHRPGGQDRPAAGTPRRRVTLNQSRSGLAD
jgi:hypothetical protein